MSMCQRAATDVRFGRALSRTSCVPTRKTAWTSRSSKRTKGASSYEYSGKRRMLRTGWESLKQSFKITPSSNFETSRRYRCSGVPAVLRGNHAGRDIPDTAPQVTAWVRQEYAAAASQLREIEINILGRAIHELEEEASDDPNAPISSAWPASMVFSFSSPYLAVTLLCIGVL